MAASYQHRASLDAELAKQRALQVGRAVVTLPDPLLPGGLGGGDPELEKRRAAEFASLRARCEAEAAVWNAEAMRWATERAEIAGEYFRLDASKLARQPGGLLQPGDRMLEEGQRSEQSSDAEDADEDAEDAEDEAEEAAQQHAEEQLFFACEAGLTAFTDLAEMAQRELDINAAVAEAHERTRWMHAAAERRRALSTLQKEQRSAFIARWLRKASQAYEEDAAAQAAIGGSPGASGPATPRARVSAAARELELEFT